jgi:hypothetical protein
MLTAMAAQALGAVTLAEGDARAALIALREACQHWQEVDAPYELAQVRALVGMACRDLGDDDSAGWELVAARDGFHRLGAAPDVAGPVDHRRSIRSGSGGSRVGPQAPRTAVPSTATRRPRGGLSP